MEVQKFRSGLCKVQLGLYKCAMDLPKFHIDDTGVNWICASLSWLDYISKYNLRKIVVDSSRFWRELAQGIGGASQV